MPLLKVGTRLKSAVCATEVMVVAAPGDQELDIRCGGAPMLAPGDAATGGAAAKVSWSIKLAATAASG